MNAPPKRKPDAVVEEKTSPSQAALYRYAHQLTWMPLFLMYTFCRLSGDPNPLHVRSLPCCPLLCANLNQQILPEFAAIGGFDKPILHGKGHCLTINYHRSRMLLRPLFYGYFWQTCTEHLWRIQRYQSPVSLFNSLLYHCTIINADLPKVCWRHLPRGDSSDRDVEGGQPGHLQCVF